MGEAITLVRCWHGRNPSTGGVILNQDTPGTSDVSVTNEVESCGGGGTTLLGGADRDATGGGWNDAG